MKKIIFFVSLFSFSFAHLSLASELQEYEKLYKKTCRACHGPKGKGGATFPKIAGLTAENISQKLSQYRAGETLGPNSALMKPIAAKLSDDEIAGLSEYISTSFQ